MVIWSAGVCKTLVVPDAGKSVEGGGRGFVHSPKTSRYPICGRGRRAKRAASGANREVFDEDIPRDGAAPPELEYRSAETILRRTRSLKGCLVGEILYVA